MPKTKRTRVDHHDGDVNVSTTLKSQKLENADSSSSEETLPFSDFLANSPRRVILTQDQYKHCSQALKFYENKLGETRQITDDFRNLSYPNEAAAEEEDKTCNVALSGANQRKNRYDNILPFDENRVVLKGRDYINASFINASLSQFIATQGPMPNTYEDFWEMVIQYRCRVVVMLACLSSDKCGDYFQSENEREFGNVCVVTKWLRSREFSDTNSSLVLRLLEVKHKDSEEPPFSVLHVQYPEWPDHGAPTDTLPVREIMKGLIYQEAEAQNELGPIVVHCSAGIGRTGTYCTVHDTMKRILAGDMTALDVAETVATFRTQRAGMVQTMKQFWYCYSVIIDELQELLSDHRDEE